MPSQYTYSIRNGLINKNLRFGKLSQGDYTLRYDVSTMDGHTFTKTYSFTVKGEDSYSNDSISSGYYDVNKLIDAARADIDKNYAAMGFSRGSNWCAKSVDLWLNDIGIDLGETPVVNDVVERLVGKGYSSTAYVFRDTRDKFTDGNLYNLYGSSKVTKVENRYNVEIKPGDILCFRWKNSPYENYSHIGIVVSYDESKREITTIEGNTGTNNPNTSCVMERTRNFDETVVAIVRLK